LLVFVNKLSLVWWTNVQSATKTNYSVLLVVFITVCQVSDCHFFKFNFHFWTFLFFIIIREYGTVTTPSTFIYHSPPTARRFGTSFLNFLCSGLYGSIPISRPKFAMPTPIISNWSGLYLSINVMGTPIKPS